MQQILFSNPVFKPGLNFTVRLGEKWKDKLRIGDFVEIEGFDGIGRIRKIYVCKLAEISQEVLENEHDPQCRKWESLVEVLRQVYPELQNKSGEEIEEVTVTCIGFWLYKRC